MTVWVLFLIVAQGSGQWPHAVPAGAYTTYEACVEAGAGSGEIHVNCRPYVEAGSGR